MVRHKSWRILNESILNRVVQSYSVLSRGNLKSEAGTTKQTRMCKFFHDKHGNLPRNVGRIIAVFDARIVSSPPASAGLVPAERQLICYFITTLPLLPRLSFPLAPRAGRKVGEGIFALAGSWSVVIPTGASPVEIRKHRSYFSLIP